VPGVQNAIYTRAIPIAHFFIPVVTFSTLIFFYDEIRKMFVRKGMVRISTPEGNMIKYPGFIARNTVY
jgi:hypothetical protein